MGAANINSRQATYDILWFLTLSSVKWRVQNHQIIRCWMSRVERMAQKHQTNRYLLDDISASITTHSQLAKILVSEMVIDEIATPRQNVVCMWLDDIIKLLLRLR